MPQVIAQGIGKRSRRSARENASEDQQPSPEPHLSAVKPPRKKRTPKAVALLPVPVSVRSSTEAAKRWTEATLAAALQQLAAADQSMYAPVITIVQ